MAVIVTLLTPNTDDAPDSTPRRIFEHDLGIEVELTALIPLGDAAIPHFWVRGDSIDEFERTLNADPKITALRRVETNDGDVLFTAEWEVDSPVIECIAAADGALLAANGTAAEWQLTVLFNERRDATSFHECCRAGSIPIDIESVRPVQGGDPAEQPVTAAQYEALAIAYREGYFEQPRAAGQAALADELNLSSSAVSDRIRRGVANLVADLLDAGSDD